MKLNDLDTKQPAIKALKENFEVNFNVNRLNKNQAHGMLNKVQKLMTEAQTSNKFGAEYPSYLKLVFMNQALREHYKSLPDMPKTKVITENEEVNR